MYSKSGFYPEKIMKYLLLLFCLLLGGASFAQTSNDPENNSKNQAFTTFSEREFAFMKRGIRFDLTPDGKSYFKLTVASQFRAKFAQLNDGSLGVAGDTVAKGLDFGMRRSRFSMFANLNQKFIFYAQVGTNSNTFAAGANQPRLYFHDINFTMSVIPKYLNIGAGLHYWNGLARMSSVSYGHHYQIDNPRINSPTMGQTDQAGRQFGIFARGKIHKLGYRMAVNQPFKYDGTTNGVAPVNRAVWKLNDHLAYKGYFNWQFFDQEIFSTPFMPMSRLGKHLLNLGAGFEYHPKSLVSQTETGEMRTHDYKGWAVDVHYEKPLPNNSLINFYAVFYDYDLGKNFIRSGASMNVHTGGFLNGRKLEQGAGISEFVVGTGKIAYVSGGYLLPEKWTKHRKIMPSFALTYKNLEALDEASWQYDLGMVYFLYGHHAKLTLQYSKRPIYAGTLDINDEIPMTIHSQKGLFMMQLQFMY